MIINSLKKTDPHHAAVYEQAVIEEDRAWEKHIFLANFIMEFCKPVQRIGGDLPFDGLLLAVQEELIRLTGYEPIPPSKKTNRKQLSVSAALKVHEKHGFACVTCGTKKQLTVDHIIPISKGGGNDFENLQTMCKSCNSRKGNRI